MKGKGRFIWKASWRGGHGWRRGWLSWARCRKLFLWREGGGGRGNERCWKPGRLQARGSGWWRVAYIHIHGSASGQPCAFCLLYGGVNLPICFFCWRSVLPISEFRALLPLSSPRQPEAATAPHLTASTSSSSGRCHSPGALLSRTTGRALFGQRVPIYLRG